MVHADTPNAGTQLHHAPRTLLMVSAGLHWSFKISRQMEPWLLTLGWYTLVWKETCGAGAGQGRVC